MSKKVVKRFKLYAKANDIVIGNYYFNEHDGNEWENKAHLSYIDKMTTNFSNSKDFFKDSIDNYKKRLVDGYGIKLCEEIDKIYLPDLKLYLEHNADNNIVKDDILYKDSKEITKVPLKSFTECKIDSKEFKDFYYRLRRMLLSSDNFYYEIMNSDYYFGSFKNHVQDLREGTDDEYFHDVRLKEFLKNYAVFRKAYIDVEKYNKRI